MHMVHVLFYTPNGVERHAGVKLARFDTLDELTDQLMFMLDHDMISYFKVESTGYFES